MPSGRAAQTRLLCHLSLGLLLLLQMLESFLQQPPVLVWLVRVLPLLIFLPGMLADKPRSYIWLCFVCLLYFVTLVERLFIDPANVVAILAMISLTSVFVSAMLYVRWRSQQLREESSSE